MLRVVSNSRALNQIYFWKLEGAGNQIDRMYGSQNMHKDFTTDWDCLLFSYLIMAAVSEWMSQSGSEYAWSE